MNDYGKTSGLSPRDHARSLAARADAIRSRRKLIPVRIELLDGTTAIRAVTDLEDDTIRRAFNAPTRTLDERCVIEWSKSGKERASSSLSRQADGMVFRLGAPIGKIAVAFEGEERHFRDHDPTDPSDRLRLGY
ncbi:MAG: hypothetical protein NVS3B10_00260 [Polyangiales bacterium]